MKVLLVYPKYPDTFWSFRYALDFISKKAAFPPLGLMTVSSLLPSSWERKLVDMNVTNLETEHVRWADVVFISAMAVQRSSSKEVIRLCKALGKKVVCGGPLFSLEPDFFPEVDHIVVGEGELTVPELARDLEAGKGKKIYKASRWAFLESESPSPDWSIVNMDYYASMAIQFSRGCPFDCEFCDITYLFGRKPRTKSKDQIVGELEALYRIGWRGDVFFVDDNFIGNKRKIKKEILPALVEWSQKKNYPFSFLTEASINLAEDDELIELMTAAGFDSVFVGIESPNENSLVECNKFQNRRVNLKEAVKKLQRKGLRVLGGFIVGFDSDPPTIFDSQIEFIEDTGIVTAMVGLLNAPPGSKLYKRLKSEGRITGRITGDNTDFTMNFIPKMDKNMLISGYKRIISAIYSPRAYYRRIKKFLNEYQLPRMESFKLKFSYIKAFLKSMWKLGIKEKERLHYWKLLAWTFFKKPRALPLAVRLSIYGYHFRKIFEIVTSKGMPGKL